ncbi:MAG: YibE/F family protein [Treponema sp.]|nr:YibE/F family protein [Treponema sp.]
MHKDTSSAAVIASVLCIIILLLLPTGFEGALQFRDAVKCKVKIVSTDNSRIRDTGLIRYGQQVCTIKFINGMFKGRTAEGWNMLNGSLEDDKLFVPGDTAQAVVHHTGNEIISVNLIDHYRLSGEFILAAAFALFLIFFARGVGARAVVSFVLTVLTIWKVLVPLYLKGIDPVTAGLTITAFLTFAILALVYGFDRRLLSSFSGAMLGILLTAVLSVFCTKGFKIHGAIMAYSESLLYAGFESLNLTRIFMSSICIGASGAVMDLSVDITSAVSEVVRNRPDISRRDAIKSGMAVARAAMGTMTTTLLLAYSGSSIALLMTFMAQGTPVYNILNYRRIAAEIIDTIGGSFGLAAAAPFTALLAGLLLPRSKHRSIL